MKMTQADYRTLKLTLKAHIEKLGDKKIQNYRNAIVEKRANGTLHCSDPVKFFTWGVFNSLGHMVTSPMIRKFYSYLNDSHLDTALKSAFQDLGLLGSPKQIENAMSQIHV